MMRNITLRFRAVDKQGFDDIRSGKKEIETRAATTKYQNISTGDTLTFTCAGEKFTKTITKIHHWQSIDAMVDEVSFKKIMPRIETIQEMRAAYASYPGYTDKIKEHGLVGFELS